MVTNGFGNRNFIQPMGRLSMHTKCLDLFFLLSFGFGGRGGGFFSFFLLFPVCSFEVPSGFSSGSQYVP
jgi:hypothetical protein